MLAATSGAYTWVTGYTETYNKHWHVEGRPSPYERFPRLPYFSPLFQVLSRERITWLEKSRDLMISWACVAYLTHRAMTIPECEVIFQCQKEDKSIQLIDYAKCLYRRQPDFLKEAFPLAKSLNEQPKLSLEFANGSNIFGIPGGASQIRSFHPDSYLLDEASFVVEAGECYEEALSAAKGKIILNSSAGPGWFADARRDIVRNEE